MFLRIVACAYAPFVISRPFRKAVRLEPVEVVFNQFVERGSGDIRELYLSLLRSAARRTALGYVLLAAPGSLRHLIDRSVAVRREKPPAKQDRALVDNIALAIDNELLVAAMRQYNPRWDGTTGAVPGTAETSVTSETIACPGSPICPGGPDSLAQAHCAPPSFSVISASTRSISVLRDERSS